MAACFLLLLPLPLFCFSPTLTPSSLHRLSSSQGPTPDGKAQPKVLNFDGHLAHIYNEPLKQGLEQNSFGLSPPAHTSAPPQRLPGTQQADLSGRDGGGIALFKAALRPKLRKQFRAALQKPKGQGYGQVRACGRARARSGSARTVASE